MGALAQRFQPFALMFGIVAIRVGPRTDLRLTLQSIRGECLTFECDKHLITQEANAIGTAYPRLDLL